LSEVSFRLIHLSEGAKCNREVNICPIHAVLNQLGYSVASLLGLLNDSILSHPRPGVSPVAEPASASAVEESAPVDGRERSAAAASVMLAVITRVQVLLELL